MDNLGKTSLASKTLILQLSLLVFPMFALKFWYFFKHWRSRLWNETMREICKVNTARLHSSCITDRCLMKEPGKSFEQAGTSQCSSCNPTRINVRFLNFRAAHGDWGVGEEEISVNTGALMLLATRHIKYFWKCKCFVLQEDPLLEILQLSTWKK